MRSKQNWAEPEVPPLVHRIERRSNHNVQGLQRLPGRTLEVAIVRENLELTERQLFSYRFVVFHAEERAEYPGISIAKARAGHRYGKNHAVRWCESVDTLVEAVTALLPTSDVTVASTSGRAVVVVAVPHLLPLSLHRSLSPSFPSASPSLSSCPCSSLLLPIPMYGRSEEWWWWWVQQCMAHSDPCNVCHVIYKNNLRIHLLWSQLLTAAWPNPSTATLTLG